MSRYVGVCAAVFPALGAVNFEFNGRWANCQKGFLSKKHGAMKLSLKNLSFEWRSHGVSTTMVSTLGAKTRVERRLDHTGASSVHEASSALFSDQSAPLYVKPRVPHFLAPPMAVGESEARFRRPPKRMIGRRERWEQFGSLSLYVDLY